MDALVQACSKASRKCGVRKTVRQRSVRFGLIFALLFTVVGSVSQPLTAAPNSAPPPNLVQQQPDWMTPDQAQRLNLDFPVLVPSWIPSPFGSQPYTVEGSGGYYRLYWLVTGGDPTFFEI